ncbi:hypothetical protein [Streptomyces mutabilis]|jgi:hypothetical protein|uniref:hypothetical protein n=1 Tax=Streptomyces mutabilis TaxID=67332 RepID=UPI0036961312
MFNVNLDTIEAQLGATAAMSIFNDPQIGNRAVLTTHYEDESTFEDSSVVMMFKTAELDALAKLIERAREGLAAAERGGIVGLATWAEKNSH